MQDLSEYIRHRSEVCYQNTVPGAKYSCVPENWEVDELLDNACLKVNGGYILNIGKLHDYDVFLNENNLEASDDTYKLWEQLIVGHWMHLPAICGPSWDPWDVYVGVDNSVVHERLGESLPADDLIKVLVDKFEFHNPKIYASQSRKGRTFDIEFDDESIFGTWEFKSVLAFHNYYIETIDKEHKIVRIAPWKPSPATDYVYDKCDGIIWHITTKDAFAKEKKYGLSPRRIQDGELKRPFRRFFIATPDKDRLKRDLGFLRDNLTKGINDRMEKQGKKYRVSLNDQILLRIDLKQRREKIKFYHDNSAWHLSAVFTTYNIPPYLLEEVKFDDIL